MLKGALLLSVMCYCFYRSGRLLMYLLPLSLLYPLFKRRELAEERRKRLLGEFQEAMSILSSYLSAGYSMENAIRRSQPDIWHLLGRSSLISSEWERLIQYDELNQPLERSLWELAERSGLDDIHSFAEIFLLARKSGGDLPGILKHSTSVIREKFLLMEEIYTMNAAKRYEQKIMNVVPFFIIIYMGISAPELFNTLYSGIQGRICMTVCLGLYIAALYISNKILGIEV